MKKENPDEIRVKQYLQTLNYTHLEYEPLGNVTPDFVLNKKIAIEVRRLNRNFIKDEHLIQIESCEVPTQNSDKKDNSPWIIDELYKNIQLVIDEKDEKIKNNFMLYNEWWLILVDYITYGMTKNDFQKLYKQGIDKKKFSKIIIITPDGDFKVFKF